MRRLYLPGLIVLLALPGCDRKPVLPRTIIATFVAVVALPDDTVRVNKDF